MKIAKTLLCVALMTAVAATVLAADPLADQMKAQNKLLAQRAARADAIRKIAERIKGLHITSATTVKDFVTESDTIQTAMYAFLNGMKEVGAPKYQEDGTCELTMSVTLVTVIQELTEIHNRYYKGDKFKASDFSQMTQTNEVKEITETGSGAPRPNWTPENVAMPVKEGTSVESLDYMGAAKKFWLDRVEPQGRLGAVRAARVDGMRKLVERIAGAQVNSETIVRDFVTEKDQVDLLASALLKGARETKVLYHEDELIVEVTMEVTMRTVYETVKSDFSAHYKGDKVKLQQFEERCEKVIDTKISETGMGVPNPRFLKGGVNVATVEPPAQTLQWPPAISAKGNAAIDKNNPNAAAAKLMAFRGAELDARRKLAEQIDGLMISSKTSVKDFVAESDEIRTAMLTFQQGGHVIEDSKKTLEDGSVEVTVTIDTQPLVDIVAHYSKTVKISVNN